ncbi:MAG: NHLP leader peptide family RiPP precursor [Lactobacillales bacterium]|jgi:hypothetical protein|nr:NHLP leader peptide family RiPP precursor [Lactobacillales bacterium]
MAWSQEEMNEVYAKVMQKATTDEIFREELLNNPKSAIEKLTGEILPDDYKIKVLENDPNYTATFVLPDLKPDLDLDDLENVAGGFSDCYGEGAGQGANVCGNQVSGNQTKG